MTLQHEDPCRHFPCCLVVLDNQYHPLAWVRSGIWQPGIFGRRPAACDPVHYKLQHASTKARAECTTYLSCLCTLVHNFRRSGARSRSLNSLRQPWLGWSSRSLKRFRSHDPVFGYQPARYLTARYGSDLPEGSNLRHASPRACLVLLAVSIACVDDDEAPVWPHRELERVRRSVRRRCVNEIRDERFGSVQIGPSGLSVFFEPRLRRPLNGEMELPDVLQARRAFERLPRLT